MPFPSLLWLLWCEVTQRLILEIIEIKLLFPPVIFFFSFFFWGAIISSAHNLHPPTPNPLNTGGLAAALTYTPSLRESTVFLHTGRKWMQISSCKLLHLKEGVGVKQWNRFCFVFLTAAAAGGKSKATQLRLPSWWARLPKPPSQSVTLPACDGLNAALIYCGMEMVTGFVIATAHLCTPCCRSK